MPLCPEKRLSVETEADKQARLEKVSEYDKRKQSLETDSERQIRLQKLIESIKQKCIEETDSERQIRLQKDSESKNRKRSEETDTNRQMRLEKDRLYKKQKRAKSILQPHREVLNQEDYLSMFDNTNNAGIAEQCWAKTDINKFNKSVQYVISQCTVCQEAWPLKSKLRAP